MIYEIIEQESKENIKTQKEKNSTEDVFDYNNIIVKKPWGYEYLVFENEHVAIWILHIVRKRKTSMHCHPRKKTSLILLFGQALFRHIDGDINLDMMDGVLIEKNIFHSTEAFSPLPVSPQSENGIWIMEIESPPHKSDLVRMNDAYGRAGTKYEGTDYMVHDPESCLKLEIPQDSLSLTKKFFDCTFTVCQGTFGQKIFSDEALVSIVAKEPDAVSDNLYLKMGGLTTFGTFRQFCSDEEIKKYTLLVIEKERKVVRAADYIFSRIADLGVKNVFAVSGGGAMHLVDAVGKSDRLEYIAVHHEQTAAMAAEGCARLSGNPGAALVTSGPGGTNALTGVCGAWIDSIPTIFISGQVTTNTLLRGTGLRQFGIQESDIVSLVESVTKYAVTVTDAAAIRYHLEKAIYLATTDRPGPVWLDIPLDVQSKLINPDELESYNPDAEEEDSLDQDFSVHLKESLELLKKAKRPVLISGYGIRLSKAENDFLRLVSLLKIPVISSWTSSDLISSDHEYSIGRSGIMGSRAGNFAVQNADLLLAIGSRMSVPQVGYNFKVYAREAKKVIVDIDQAELDKNSLNPDVSIKMDAGGFIRALIKELENEENQFGTSEWMEKCKEWKSKYPICLPEYEEQKGYVNSFYFIDMLSKKLDKDAIVVTDMGTSFTCTMQTFQVKAGQRLFTSSGHASMGFGLPGAIGACMGSGKKKTICVSGDGGLQMNIQEFQTLVQYKLPIIIFILNNEGYLTIKLMQQNHFGRFVGSDPSSGVSSPDFVKLAVAYGIKADRIKTHDELKEKMGTVLNEPGPFVCEIIMAPDQPLIPRVSSLKKPDGSIIAKPLEDLYPFLDRKEFNENMIVKPIEPLK